MSARQTVAITCLGCGCACDDLVATVDGGRLRELANACALGSAWFGDGRVPEAVRVGGAVAPLEAALAEAARVLAAAGERVLVYLAPDVSSETQRLAIAVADRLRGAIDGATSETALDGILAGQRRGRATATLGEIRNRADVVVFWGIDPGERYPRYRSRYVAAASTAIGVSIGAARAPEDVDLALAFAPAQEIAALGVMRATVLGGRLGPPPAALAPAADLAARLVRGRYVAIVHDGEPGPADNPLRAEALIALAQALNGPTRAAVSTLRAGGNRSGAEAALTSQTGFPAAVDFAPAHPVYRPDHRPAARDAADFGAVLVVGSWAGVPDPERRLFGAVPVVAIGPRASEAPFSSAVAIDTGVAGIHDGGIGYRMDDVPLPLATPFAHPRSAAATLRSLHAALGAGTPAGAAR